MILHEVITAEKVPFTYRVAGLGSRFLAYLIDASLLLLLFVSLPGFSLPTPLIDCLLLESIGAVGHSMREIR